MSMLTPPRPTGWSPPDAAVGNPAPVVGPWTAPGAPVAPAPVPRRPPIWPWVLLGLAVGIAGLAFMLAVAGVLLGVSAGGEDTAPGQLSQAEVVLAEDFAVGPGPFEEYFEPGFTAQAVDGVYVITSEDLQFTDWVTVPTPQADVIELSARVALAEDSEPAAEAGVTVEGAGGGYAFTISTGSGALISRIGDAEDMDVVAYGDAVEVAAGEVRLTVEPVAGGATRVRGYLGGRLVAEYQEPAQVGGFDEVGLAVYADSVPATARFDDVLVRTASQG